MPDIFISYSSKDREQAKQLTELLASAGLSVWIDQSGIDISTSWSKEIVQAINECKAFVVLLSPNSMASNNVIKEVSLASEKRKKILPLDLEPVQLSEDFEYQLAGIQRAPMTNIDAVIRALGRLGLAATQAPSIKLIHETDARKSLMILPFEDLSPTADNAWFADGLATELISALSNVKALRVTDQQTTKEFKKYSGHLTTYAKEMSIRYFIQGSVRKFGDQIKIATSLLDIETGDHLWQDAMKGTMSDIFDIQEKVAEKVVEGLKVHLASDEKKKLAERGTENAEAYELYVKSNEYFERRTKEDYQRAIQLYSDAIKLDPTFANAYQRKANALSLFYRLYDRNPVLLEEGLNLVKEALWLKPDLWIAYKPLSHLYQLQGKLDEGEAAAKVCILNDPEDFMSHFTLGFFYMVTDQHVKAIAPYEAAYKINPEYLTTLFNLTLCCNRANDKEKQIFWAGIAIPQYERHLKLLPDDQFAGISYATLLYYAGRDAEAKMAALRLDNLTDGLSLYNLAWLQYYLKNYEVALETFCKAVRAGYQDFQKIILFIFNENFSELKGTSEYEEAKQAILTACDEHSEFGTFDWNTTYNLACLHISCNALERGMVMLRCSADKGAPNIDLFRLDPDLDPIRGTPGFEELMKELETNLQHVSSNNV